MSPNQYNGILAVQKPVGISSHDLVQQVRKIVSQRSIGHTGTLDPAAEGLLVLCLGKATKLAGYISGGHKSYEAIVRLGRESTTYDAEGVDFDTPPAQVPDLSNNEIEAVLNKLRGKIKQQVPAFSAIKVDGRRLYDIARAGEKVTPPTRQVEIFELSCSRFESPDMHLKLLCSKGTYVRSIAHDIGKRLGCGAYLAALKRTTIGKISGSFELTLDELTKLHDAGQLQEKFVPADLALDFGSYVVTDQYKTRLANGRQPTWDDVLSFEGGKREGDRVMLRDSQGTLLAIGRTTMDIDALQSQPKQPVIHFDRVLM